jgi:hypothetical protein
VDDEQLERLLNALQPDLLDWLSGLAVPLLLGVLTLLVAVWANRTARMSNDLAARAHEAELERLSLADRVEAGRLLRQFSQALVDERARGRYSTPSAMDLERGLRDEVVRLRVPGISELITDLREDAARIVRWDSGERSSVINAMATLIIQYSVDAWLRDPAKWLAERPERKARQAAMARAADEAGAVANG